MVDDEVLLLLLLMMMKCQNLYNKKEHVNDDLFPPGACGSNNDFTSQLQMARLSLTDNRHVSDCQRHPISKGNP